MRRRSGSIFWKALNVGAIGLVALGYWEIRRLENDASEHDNYINTEEYKSLSEDEKDQVAIDFFRKFEDRHPWLVWGNDSVADFMEDNKNKSKELKERPAKSLDSKITNENIRDYNRGITEDISGKGYTIDENGAYVRRR